MGEKSKVILEKLTETHCEMCTQGGNKTGSVFGLNKSIKGKKE